MLSENNTPTLNSLNSTTPFISAVDAYLNYYAGNSHHTSKAKKNDFNIFFTFLKQKKGINTSKFHLAKWSHSLTVEFLDYLLNCGEAPSTVARRLSTLKHFGRIMAENIPQFLNPAKEVRPPKTIKGKPKSLNKKDINKLKRNLRKLIEQKPSFPRYRNLVIFEFLLETGLRAEEARTLKRSQLDKNLEWIKNVKTKGKKYRNVYLASSLRETLSQYLIARDKELKKKFPKLTKQISASIPLFISLYKATPNNPDSFLMDAKSLWRAISSISSEQNVHPHLLRHSFATHLLNSSKDIRLVAQALGHSDIRVTMRYTERTDEEIAKAIEKKIKS